MLNISIINTDNPSPSKFYFGLIASIAIATGLFLSCIQPGIFLTDGGIFSAIALKDLKQGGLYLNAWENKPPGIFFLMEAILQVIPNPVYALFTLSFFAFIILAACQYTLFYKNLNTFPGSLLFSAISLYFSMNRNLIGDGLYTELFGTLCLVVSLTLMQGFIDSKRISYIYSSAFLLGASFWFKEPFILVCIPMTLIYCLQLKSMRLILILLVGAMIPSLIVLGVLYSKGSLQAFIEMIEYNFTYLISNESVSLKVKLNDYYQNLILPNAALVFMFILIVFKTIGNTKTRIETIANLLLLLSTSTFVLLSPYNFGHYYFPSFVLFFIIITRLFHLFASTNAYPLKLPLIILCLYTAYGIDQNKAPILTYTINPYQPDKIERFLLGEHKKTLFIDYVNRGDYYVKTGMIYPTFLPVALPVHFGEDKKGLENRKKIWLELSKNPPDFLITTYTTSYFSWFLPETDFYTKNYEKIDSIQPQNEHIVFLWKLKKTQ